MPVTNVKDLDPDWIWRWMFSPETWTSFAEVQEICSIFLFLHLIQLYVRYFSFLIIKKFLLFRGPQHWLWLAFNHFQNQLYMCYRSYSIFLSSLISSSSPCSSIRASKILVLFRQSLVQQPVLIGCSCLTYSFFSLPQCCGSALVSIRYGSGFMEPN